MSRAYRIYGLTLHSDLALSGGCAVPDPLTAPDLVLQLVSVPSWASDALALPIAAIRTRPAATIPGDSTFSVTEFVGGEFVLLTYGDGTRFVLDHACTRLWGSPGRGLSHDDLCVYLLGPVMGFILRKRGHTSLHASAVCIERHAVAIVGEAGAGKSTTAAALALRGWPVLCEDVCALSESAGRFQAVPGYPRVSLWPDSVQFLFQSADALPLIVQGWEKRYLPLDGARAAFAPDSVPISAIFFLAARSGDSSAPSLEPVSQREAVLHLVQDTYMNWLLDPRQRAAEFDVLTRLVSAVQCFRVTPSSDPSRLSALVDLIESQTLRTVRASSYSSVEARAPNV